MPRRVLIAILTIPPLLGIAVAFLLINTNKTKTFITNLDIPLLTKPYAICQTEKYNQDKFVSDLTEKAPEFANKVYSLGKQVGYDQTTNQTVEKSFYRKTPQILIDLLTVDQDSFIDPRIAVVLIEMATSGITSPEANPKYPFGLETKVGATRPDQEEQKFIFSVLDFKNAYTAARNKTGRHNESAAIQMYWNENLRDSSGQWSNKRFIDIFQFIFKVDPREC